MLKIILAVIVGMVLGNLLWAGLWYNNVLPNRMTSLQYIHGPKTYAIPAISFQGYSPESDFDAILADKVWKLEHGVR